MKITKEWLRRRGACSSGLEYFVKKYPRGLTLTREKLVRAFVRDEAYALWLLNRLATSCRARLEKKMSVVTYSLDPEKLGWNRLAARTKCYLKVHLVCDTLGIK